MEKRNFSRAFEKSLALLITLSLIQGNVAFAQSSTQNSGGGHPPRNPLQGVGGLTSQGPGPGPGNTGPTGNTGSTGNTGVTGNPGTTSQVGAVVAPGPGQPGYVNPLNNKYLANSNPAVTVTGPIGNTGTTGTQAFTGTQGPTGNVAFTANPGPGTPTTPVTLHPGDPGYIHPLNNKYQAQAVQGVTATGVLPGGNKNANPNPAVTSTGPLGSTGATGTTGLSANTGNTGNTGFTGVAGLTGVQTGNIGNTGNLGITGFPNVRVGNTGPSGDTGNTGAGGNTVSNPVVPNSCEDKALKEIYDILIADSQNALGVMFELTAMRLAKRALDQRFQASTFEDLTKKNVDLLEAQLKQIDTNDAIKNKVMTAYEIFGKRADLATVESKMKGDFAASIQRAKDACYFDKSTSRRFRNDEASAYIQAVILGEGDASGLSDVDSAIVWVVERARAEAEKHDPKGKNNKAGYAIGKANGNLLNISTRVTRYLGRIDDGRNMTPESMQTLIDKQQQALKDIVASVYGRVKASLQSCLATECATCAQGRIEKFENENMGIDRIQRGLLETVAKSDNLKISKDLKAKMGETVYDFSNFATKKDALHGETIPPNPPRSSTCLWTGSKGVKKTAVKGQGGNASSKRTPASASYEQVSTALQSANPGTVVPFGNGCSATLKERVPTGTNNESFEYHVVLKDAQGGERAVSYGADPDASTSDLGAFYSACTAQSAAPVSQPQKNQGRNVGKSNQASTAQAAPKFESKIDQLISKHVQNMVAKKEGSSIFALEGTHCNLKIDASANSKDLTVEVCKQSATSNACTKVSKYDVADYANVFKKEPTYHKIMSNFLTRKAFDDCK